MNSNQTKWQAFKEKNAEIIGYFFSKKPLATKIQTRNRSRDRMIAISALGGMAGLYAGLAPFIIIPFSLVLIGAEIKFYNDYKKINPESKSIQKSSPSYKRPSFK